MQRLSWLVPGDQIRSWCKLRVGCCGWPKTMACFSTFLCPYYIWKNKVEKRKLKTNKQKPKPRTKPKHPNQRKPTTTKQTNKKTPKTPQTINKQKKPCKKKPQQVGNLFSYLQSSFLGYFQASQSDKFQKYLSSSFYWGKKLSKSILSPLMWY